MKVVIAHDFIRHGGAERVLEEMHATWPDAPIHTLLSEEPPAYADWEIHSSWLQGKVPPRRYRWPLPLYPGLVDRLPRKIDWDGVDLLVTSSVSFMKNLKAPPWIPHLCYIHRPAMFVYERQDMFLSGYPAPARPFLRSFTKRFRQWDQDGADNPDLYAVNSAYVGGMVKEVYRRESTVLFPPVRTDAFRAAGEACGPGDYYLAANRLEGYKRVDLAVEASNRLGIPLKVAGRGPHVDALKELAGPQVEFLGFVPDDELVRLVAGCRGFILTSLEDFGIAPVEALAAGRPVIALGEGGPAETVEDGVTGVHFAAQTIDEVETAMRRAEELEWDPATIRDSAERFSAASFRAGLLALAEELVAQGPGPRRSR
jgi:glycosyltransferase involved in cell wall biosynthesis